MYFLVLRTKYEVFSIFKIFLAYIETQFSTCIKVLRSDSSEEYMSHKFHDFLYQKGSVSQYPCAMSIYVTAKWRCRALEPSSFGCYSDLID